MMIFVFDTLGCFVMYSSFWENVVSNKHRVRRWLTDIKSLNVLAVVLEPRLRPRAARSMYAVVSTRVK